MDQAGPVVVMGQGALGTLFAAVLAEREIPVVVVSRRAQKEDTVVLEASGKIEAKGEVRLQPEVPSEPAGMGIVTSRSAQALEVAEQVDAVVREEGVLMAVQNGLTPLRIRETLGRERVVPGVVGFNAKMRSSRRVEVTSPGGVTVGMEAALAGPGFEALVGALRGPLAVDVSRNPVGAVWSKWCISCAINGLAVVTGVGVGRLTGERLGREALVGLISETTEVAHAEGVVLERVAGPLAPDSLAGSNRGLGGRFRRGVAWLIGRGYGDVVPSSLDAAREGRDPELEALNEEAVALGEQHGVPVPWNRAVVDVAKAVLAGEMEASVGLLEALKGRVDSSR